MSIQHVSTEFTSQELKLILDRLNNYKPICGVCRTGDWTFTDHVEQSIAGGKILVMLPLVCITCGNTLLLNLKLLGLTSFMDRRAAGEAKKGQP